MSPGFRTRSITWRGQTLRPSNRLCPTASGVSPGKPCSGDNIQWVPAISNGFTDSRFTRPLGTVTYGFSGSHPDDDPMLNYSHGTNESVGIKSLVSGTKIMLGLACDMLAVK